MTNLPPIDKRGEFKIANLTIERCRRLIDKCGLDDSWLVWVGDSIAAGIQNDVRRRQDEREYVATGGEQREESRDLL